MRGIMPTTGDTMVRTILTTTMIGKLRSSNTWKCQAKKGVVS